MPNHCSVRGCRANSKNGPREKVFCFPKDQDLLKKWLHAINREDFVPSIHSKLQYIHSKISVTEYEEHIKMPGHCCVPHCNANYPSGPRVSVFSFPKDEEILKKWLAVVPKKNLVPTQSTKVCQRHFKPEDIVKETSAFDTKKQVTITVTLKNHRLKPDAVPSIFEDIPTKPRKKVKNSPIKDNQEKSKIESSVGTSMQSKNAKSPLSSVSETGVHNSCRQDAEMKGSFKSPKKASTTTDRPIIAVIKAEDLIMEEDGTTEKTEEEDDDDGGDDDEEDDDDCVIEMQSPGANSASSTSSPFKNLPNVSVCLKEEDRVPITRELKGVKRSPSTGSSSSTGSTDAQKLSSPLTKRRKVEKPAPVVIGRQNDCYCWVCHRENITLCCIACPRAFHPKCAGELTAVTPDWVCPECQKILAAENVDTRSSTLAEISLDKLGALLKLSLNKMKQRAPIAFHQPVSLEHYPLYLHYVIHPMDFSLLEKNIKQKVYGCTEAFLSDVKWISHNSCVFNGTQHPLSTNAKNLVKACDQDMQEIEVCPDCFVHSVVHNKYWFSEVCRKPHPLVWAKLKGFPYWPAKVVRILDGNVDARFFGAHDRAWVPVSQCYHLSKEMPTTSKPKKKGNYEVALDELNVHVHLLIQKFGSFEYAPYRTCFNPQNKFLMYHGIDIDKVAKEEISFDTSSPVPEKFHLAEKENRFASFLESEREKLIPDESKFSENLLEKQIKSPLELKIGMKSPLHFSERKSTDLLQSMKETDDDEEEEDDNDEKNDAKANQEKSMLEDKTNNQIRTVEEKKADTSQVSPIKISEKVSASDQFRKLELALERIKGYVSLTSEPEKENNETLDKQSEENINKDDKNASENINKDERKTSSSLFNDTVTLPVIESENIQESNIDVTKSLETTKKTDSFFLKLNETIESCKAKLGISEVTDDLSDESGADENASRSDEDEEENSSASEAEEEVSDEELEEEEEDDEEEDEVVEVSDDELENGEEENELGDKAEESDEEEDEESNSGTSDTDIENQNSDASPKKSFKSYTLDSEDSRNEEATSDSKDMHSVNEDECKVTDSNVKEIAAVRSEACTDPDIQGPKVTVKDSNASEVGENTSSEILTESSSDMKEASSKVPLNQTTSNQSMTSENAEIGLAAFSMQCNAETVSSKEDSSSIIIEESMNKSMPVNMVSDKSDHKSMQNRDKTLEGLSQKEIEEKCDVQSDVEMKPVEDKENSLSFQCKNEPVDEDDDIYICTPTRPKSPPVIVLDDDAENEDSSVSDTYAVKSPPYSTSVESFSNEENPTCNTNSGDEQGNSPSKMAVNGQALNESFQKETASAVNGKADSLSPSERRKRKLSSEDSSDDEIQIVQPVKKIALTGAKRTFNKINSVDTPKRVSPTLESVTRNLAKETLERANISPASKSSEVESEALRSEPTSPVQSPVQSPQLMLKSPVIDTSNLSDQEKQLLFLKRKLTCLMTAYKIQGWKCNQEREELRHNMNLIIMEMRACFESDKKQAIDALVRKYEKEKQKGIEEAKRKQWCAYCLTESRYSCCWNTSYCSVECQKRHFLEHRNSCTQIKNKNIEIVEVKSNGTPPVSMENNENKRVIIVNMKPPETSKSVTDKPATVVSQQTPINKPEIQILATKTTLQSSPSTNVSNPVQLVKAPVKATSDSNVVTSASSLNVIGKNLDSAQIISDVRNRTCNLGTAISLLKKKNLESTLSVLTKKKEQKQKEEASKEDSNLEDLYFPSPPKVTFEGYDSVNEDPNSATTNETEEAKMDCDIEADTSELPSNATIEQDIVLSDTDDMDNEMVNIGHGVDVKAKFLNKCLVYGTTPKKLTRCLVDIIFPDIKLLASCSAFGQKSNVTKLTRAGLPTRKVHAIIDYVIKRFPSSATRSEIVLAINMKCKEARIIVNRKDSDLLQKSTIRRLLAKEQEDEQAPIVTTSTAITTSSPTIITPVISTKNSPNVVCVKSSTQLQPVPLNLPKKPASVPSILHCNPQLLVNSKPVLSQMGNAAVLQTLPQRKKRETVKELLSKNKNLSVGHIPIDRPQILMAVDAHKQSATNIQPTIAPSSSTANTRPYIIIGSHVNAAKQSTSVQNPSVPASSDHTK